MASLRQLAAPLLLLLLPLASANPNAPCYYPDHDGQALGFYPCVDSSFIANCCPQGWSCFSNGLCVVTTETASFPNLTLGAVIRGACTNPDWNSNICGDRCLRESSASSSWYIGPG